LIDTFITLLQQQGVTAIADVRSVPYSRFNPQFNRKELEQSLKPYGIRYVFLGRELGARSDDPSCYEKGRIQYARMARTDVFQSGIQRVICGASDYRIALMCAEKEPLECHRTLLVARALIDLGVPVAHILADGRLEAHEITMERLLDIVGLPQQDLFLSKDELIAHALAKQEERIAYVNKKLADTSTGETP